MSARLTDTDFVASVLADHEWHTQTEILSRSKQERGCGLTLHSRVSDLRVKRGYMIEQRSRRGSDGRVVSSYRMVGTLDESGVGRNHGFALSSPDSSSGLTSEPSALTDRRAVVAQPPLGEVASEVEPLELDAVTCECGQTDDHSHNPRFDVPAQLVLDVPLSEREREAA